MGNEKLKNLFLILIVIIVIISVPYLLYTLGSLIGIDNFGYINNWWFVLLFVVLLISVFVLRGINIEKKMGSFFLILFIGSFFILGIRFGVKPIPASAAYTALLDKEHEIDSLDATLSKLENKFTTKNGDDSIRPTNENSDLSHFEIIFFHQGSSELSTYNERRISDFVDAIGQCTINIHGYSDDSGNETTNTAISTARAQAVADFIASMNRDNLVINSAVGFGDDQPLVANTDEFSRSKNRRVTIEVIRKVDETLQKSNQLVLDEIAKTREELTNLREERDSLRSIIFKEE